MLNHIENLLKHIIGIIMFLITVIIFAQVVSRYIFNSPFTWSEEMARYLVIWMVFIGMPVGVRDSTHLALGLNLLTKLPRLLKFLTEILLDLIILFLFIYITKYGYLFSIKSVTSMAMTVPMSLSFLYIAVPACATLSVVFTIEKIYKQFKEFNN